MITGLHPSITYVRYQQSPRFSHTSGTVEAPPLAETISEGPQGLDYPLLKDQPPEVREALDKLLRFQVYDLVQLYLQAQLDKAGGSKKKAAEASGIALKTLYNRFPV